MKLIKNCPFCKKEFQGYDRSKWGKGIYCSRNCQYNARKSQRIEHTCEVCKIKFNTVKSSTKRFCSSKCAYMARSTGLVKRIVNKPYKKQPISSWRKKICIICKKPYIARYRMQTHCSKDCANITLSKIISGKLNRFYINGNAKKKRSYRGDEWSIIRRRIYKRDNWTCRICGVHCVGKNSKDTKKIIQCHHIVPWKISKDNSDSNLITTCLKCHSEIESSNKRLNYAVKGQSEERNNKFKWLE